MSALRATYLKFEMLRLFRNRQNFIFSLAFPVALYLFVAGQNKSEMIGQISFPTYYMAGMIAFGGMGAVVGGGARIALERDQGWTRQLRISPLSARAYVSAKVAGAYLMAAITIGLVYACAIGYGVSMTATRWIEMTGLVLIGLAPFAALGVLLGHVIKGDTMGPIMGGGISFLSILGGAFGPIGQGSWFEYVSKAVPTYWIVQAGHIAVDERPWGATGWAVVLGWTVVLTAGALWAYRRDTGKA